MHGSFSIPFSLQLLLHLRILKANTPPSLAPKEEWSLLVPMSHFIGVGT